MEISVLDASAVTGLAATVVLSINYLLGMMLGTAYKKSAYWKKLPVLIKKVSINTLHNWTAYVAFFLILLHPLWLLPDAKTKFHLSDILFPVHAPSQKAWVILGSLSMYAFAIVVITSQKIIRRKMSFRSWKNIHLVSYATAILFCLHGIFMDPELKNRTPDFLDGEKLIPEICFLALIVASVIRYKYHLQKKHALHNKPSTYGQVV